MAVVCVISHDINIMGGKACIKGTRVTVGMIITQLSEGKDIETLLDMNISPKLVDLLQSRGADAKHWISIGKSNFRQLNQNCSQLYSPNRKIHWEV